MKIQTFTPNETGNDYICSDIHGHFTLLEKQLSLLNFDQENDRLFCLGDLVDRGDESNLVIEYLSKPWFYSILGNHELLLIDAYESDSAHVRTQWNFWGGDWAEDYDDAELERYYEVFVTLPMAIELMLPNNRKIALVHAELPDVCDWNQVKKELVKKELRDSRTEAALLYGMHWNKGQLSSPQAAHNLLPAVANIDHVFHGHTIVNEMATIGNRTFLDLGSYKTGLLGLINPSYFLAKLSSK